MEGGEWVSQRYLDNVQRRNRIEAFDKFVDLALDDVITLEQALTGFMEEYGHEYKTAPEGAV